MLPQAPLWLASACALIALGCSPTDSALHGSDAGSGLAGAAGSVSTGGVLAFEAGAAGRGGSPALPNMPGLLAGTAAGGAGAAALSGGAGAVGQAGADAAVGGMSGSGRMNSGRAGHTGQTPSAGRVAAGSGGAAGRASAGAAGGCVENLSCQLAAPPSTGDIEQDCVDRINQFRTQCACLPALQRWNEGEACADQMARYDSGQGTAHAGFMADICDGGNAQNECPGWSSQTQVISGCLQQMWNEGPPPTQPCNGSCFQTYGHFINMTNKSLKKVACGFFKTDQNKIWAVQNFSP
jgi:hypothetical protein